jgi:hypothetical protein
MTRFWTAGLAILALVVFADGARAQLDITNGATAARPAAPALQSPDTSDVPAPNFTGPTFAEPTGAARSLAEPRKADKIDNDFSVSLASAVGRPLRLNGRDGALTLWGREKALKIAKLTLVGEVISDPSQKCQIDIVGAGPIDAKSLGRPDGLARFEAEIPACTFTFDVVEGGVLVPAQGAACVFKAADCRASPSGLWGADGDTAAGEVKEIATERAHAEDAATRILKSVKAKFKGKPEADSLGREQADFAAHGSEICLDYDRESEHGFCASRMAEARAALLKARADRLARGDKAQD